VPLKDGCGALEVDLAAVAGPKRRQGRRVELAAQGAKLAEQVLQAGGGDQLQDPRRGVAGVPEGVPLPTWLEDQIPGLGVDLLVAQQRPSRPSST
jgi:hypothetical protein